MEQKHDLLIKKKEGLSNKQRRMIKVNREIQEELDNFIKLDDNVQNHLHKRNSEFSLKQSF